MVKVYINGNETIFKGLFAFDKAEQFIAFTAPVGAKIHLVDEDGAVWIGTQYKTMTSLDRE